MADQISPSRDPKDTDRVVQELSIIRKSLTLGVKSLIKIQREVEFSKLNIAEINECLQSVKLTTKEVSILLDHTSELRSDLVQQLRVKTRIVLDEESV